MSTPNNEQLRPVFNSDVATEFLFSLQISWMAQGVNGYIELRSFRDKDRDGDYGHSVFIPIDGGYGDVEEGVAWAEKESAKQRGVFYGANPRSTNTGDKASVRQIVASYQDLDIYKADKSKEDAYNFAVNSAKVEADFVIDSGGGYQVIFLHEPVKESDWLPVQQGLLEWGKDYGADSAVVKDYARVLRLPGAPNWKQPEPRLTSVVFDAMKSTPTRHGDLYVVFAESGQRERRYESKVMTVPEGSYHEYLVNRAAVFANIPGMTPEQAEMNLRAELARLPDRTGEGVRSNAQVAEDIPGIVAHRFKNHDGNGFAGTRSNNPATFDDDEATPQKAKNSGGGFGAFMAKQFPKREYLIHGLARGMVGMIHADESSYKSWNAVNLAMMEACGRPHPVFTKAKPREFVADAGPRNTAYAMPRRAVYMDFENDAESLQEIMLGLLQNFNEYERELINTNLYIVVDAVVGNPDSEDEDETLTLSGKAHLRGIADEIQAFFGGEDPDLIIVDTLAEGFDLPEENSNGKQGAGLVSAAVRYLRHRLSNPAILLIHHNSKRSGGDGEANQSDETRFRGATRLSNMCRWRWGQTQKRDASGQYIKGTAVGVHYKSKGPKINDGDPVEMVFDFDRGGLLAHADFEPAPVRPVNTASTDPRHKSVKDYLTGECNLNDRGATSQAGEILDILDSDPSALKGWILKRHKGISERTADRRSQRIRELCGVKTGVTGG
jgi:hypothetical protein